MPGPTTTSNSVLATWTSKAFYIPLSWVQEASHLFGHPSKIRSFILLTHTHTRIKKTSTSHGRLHLFRSIQSFRPTSPTVQEPPLELFDARLSCPRCSNLGANYAVLRDGWALPRAGGNMGHMRKDTGKCILAECPKCSERWQQDGVV
ncbi:unnamed protein product [Durusdinium trenchii]|uniref:Uncharacterized protein n=1 Tax=Durusdinium trenchii TaxID=1381693 RepID=A0ABP0MPB7_9DINO